MSTHKGEKDECTSKTTAQTIHVSADKFSRAETDFYFGGAVKEAGGIGKFFHHRVPAAIDNQTVVRMNRDTLYSSGVFDLDAGPVTIKLPDPGKRFRSMQIVNEDQYTLKVVYDAGSYTLDRDTIGTRYVIAIIRPRLSTPTILRTLNKSTRCRMPPRSSRPAQANSKFRIGTWKARRKSVKPSQSLDQACPTQRRCSGARTR